ncbi:hypothetical protein FBHYGVHD_CDS0057 [Staphylococcus phage MVC_VPHSA1]|uniref:Uncharacterized protein n=1 Tax=Staphylococcus phage MVC_VPHSA1 TaxID=3088876 RepID=A0ABZ0QZG5_9CAUD|nr:hypothetical protein FBHYGVHD_CDS0057 [Staphylococcus phage MVC_VPHSA1]
MLNERNLFDKTAPNMSTGIINGRYSGVLNWDNVRFKWAFPLTNRFSATSGHRSRFL